mgnify:CR=1 FL=1
MFNTLFFSELYCKDCRNYGQMVKIKEKNSLVSEVREKVFGNPHVSSISTSVVEGFIIKFYNSQADLEKNSIIFEEITRIYCCINHF